MSRQLADAAGGERCIIPFATHNNGLESFPVVAAMFLQQRAIVVSDGDQELFDDNRSNKDDSTSVAVQRTKLPLRSLQLRTLDELLGNSFDVIVVGGGPIGLFVATSITLRAAAAGSPLRVVSCLLLLFLFVVSSVKSYIIGGNCLSSVHVSFVQAIIERHQQYVRSHVLRIDPQTLIHFVEPLVSFIYK